MWLETLEEIRELNTIKERRLSQYVLAEKLYQFAVKALSQKTDKLLKVIKEVIIEEDYPIDEIRDILNFRLIQIHSDLRICQVVVD